MSMRDVEVWDERDKWYDEKKEATIGVNWASVGPVTPSAARRFAHSILKAADRATERRAKARADGWKLIKV